MYNTEALLTAYKERSSYYCGLGDYENHFPGSIGFITPDTEIFVVRENFIHRLFFPRFFLYNHKTNTTQAFLFKEIDKGDQCLLDFLNTVRDYSLDRERWPLIRTYYDDLISEWEINNKRCFPRKYMCK